jgi:predicted secreted protein
MAVLTGNDGSLVVGSTTVAALRNFSIEQTSDTIETTTMGKEVRTYLKGMSAWSGSADLYFDTTDVTTSTGTFFTSISTGAVGDSPVVLKAYVKDDATNDIAFTGTVIVTGYTVNSAMDGIVEASVSFQGSGPIIFSRTGSV